jgi:DUF971 family protein
MATQRPPDATHVARLTEVGRYALGVTWGDNHDSILPHRALRRACPCDACAAAGDPDAPRPPDADRLVRAELLGDRSVFFRFGDGHETVLLLDELRDLCRCARCVGEPDYPISGS